MSTPTASLPDKHQTAIQDCRKRFSLSPVQRHYVYRATVAVIAVYFLGAYVLGSTYRWELRPDSITYRTLGDSLANEEGYVAYGELHRKFPPVYPLHVALVTLVQGGDTWAHMLLVKSLAALCVVLAFVWFAERYSHGGALLLCLAFAANCHFHEYANRIQSEVPFTLYSLLALYLSTRLLREPPPTRFWLSAIALSAVIGLAIGCRTVGIALIPALCIAILLQTRWPMYRRVAVMLLIGLSVTAAIWGWKWYLVPTDGGAAATHTYADELLQLGRPDSGSNVATAIALLGRCVQNVLIQARGITCLLTNSVYSHTPITVSLLLYGALFLGWTLALRRARGPCEYYVAAYLGIYLLWPYDAGARFYMPVLPFLIHYLVLAVQAVLATTAKLRDKRLLAAACVCFAGALFAVGTCSSWVAESWHGWLAPAVALAIGIAIAVCAFGGARIGRLGYGSHTQSQQLLTWGIVLLVTMLGTLQTARQVRNEQRYTAHALYITRPQWVRAAAELRRLASTGDTVCVGKYRQFEVLTRLRCFPCPLHRDRTAVARQLAAHRWVIDLHSSADDAFLRPLLTSDPQRYRRVFSDKWIDVYQIVSKASNLLKMPQDIGSAIPDRG